MVSRNKVTIQIPDDLARGLEGIAAAQSKSVELDLPPVLTQTVKTQNPFKGELSHGVVA
jgi:predicted transcriptional regulator